MFILSFSTEDVYRMAQATGVEVRAKYNNYTSHGIYNQYHGGLSCWSPVVNIVRDPRWGRNQVMRFFLFFLFLGHAQKKTNNSE